MPLVSITGELRKARDGGYAVPLLETFELSGAEAVLRTIDELRAPAILGVYAGWLRRPSGAALAACLPVLARAARSPVSVMLDHATDLDDVRRALDCGFTDVMVDGSALPPAENARQARRAVELAHAAGAGVEAEVGRVGGRGSAASREGYTDPEEAAAFVAETGVDLLAVAVGTAHGGHAGEARLDLDLLGEIRRRVRVPLVLHGGSSLSEEQIRAAIGAGVAKINLASDLIRTAGQALIAAARADDASFFRVMAALRDALAERTRHYLTLLGAAGKAAEA